MALGAGPFLAQLAHRHRRAASALDGFVLVALVGLILLFIMPHALSITGWTAVLFAAAGLVAPTLAERWLHGGDGHHRHHPIVSALALAGLSLHAFTDGAALSSGEHHEGLEMLASGVVLHRLPLGLIVWNRARPKVAVPLLLLIGGATIAGFGFGGAGLPLMSNYAVGALEAFVAGSLLHVAMEPPVADTAGHSSRPAAGIGSLAAFGLLAALALDHGGDGGSEGSLGAGHTFFVLALESAPALLLGFAAAGVVQALLRAHTARWLVGRGPVGSSMRGMVFGLPLPLCSCGVVPVYRTLVRAGAPAAAAFAFLVATPEIGLDAFFLSFQLLGWELALIRIGSAAVVALAVGLIMANTTREDGEGPRRPEPTTEDTFGARLRAGLRFGFGDLFEHIMPWVIIGLLVAALTEPLLSSGWLQTLPAGVDVGVMAVVGMPTYVCASGATPLVAVLMNKGLSAGGAVAFLIAGPATNLTTIGIVRALHGKRAALRFALVVPALAIGLGLLVNATGFVGAPVRLDELVGHGPTVIEMGSLAVMTALILRALLRRGPRELLEEVTSPIELGAHEHEHA